MRKKSATESRTRTLSITFAHLPPYPEFQPDRRKQPAVGVGRSGYRLRSVTFRNDRVGRETISEQSRVNTLDSLVHIHRVRPSLFRSHQTHGSLSRLEPERTLCLQTATIPSAAVPPICCSACCRLVECERYDLRAVTGSFVQVMSGSCCLDFLLLWHNNRRSRPVRTTRGLGFQ